MSLELPNLFKSLNAFYKIIDCAYCFLKRRRILCTLNTVMKLLESSSKAIKGSSFIAVVNDYIKMLWSLCPNFIVIEAIAISDSIDYEIRFLKFYGLSKANNLKRQETVSACLKNYIINFHEIFLRERKMFMIISNQLDSHDTNNPCNITSGSIALSLMQNISDENWDYGKGWHPEFKLTEVPKPILVPWPTIITSRVALSPSLQRTSPSKTTTNVQLKQISYCQDNEKLSFSSPSRRSLPNRRTLFEMSVSFLLGDQTEENTSIQDHSPIKNSLPKPLQDSQEVKAEYTPVNIAISTPTKSWGSTSTTTYKAVDRNCSTNTCSIVMSTSNGDIYMPEINDITTSSVCRTIEKHLLEFIELCGDRPESFGSRVGDGNSVVRLGGRKRRGRAWDELRNYKN